MKPLLTLSFLLILHGAIFGQLPDIKHNYSRQDSTENPLIDSFAKQYDLVITYTEQSYWSSERKNYKILAYADNKWTSWTYSNYVIQITKRKKQDKSIIDTVRTGSYHKNKAELQETAIAELFSVLNNNGFWILNNDSLNQTRSFPFRINNGDTTYRMASISDGVNYRFDILTISKLRVIESYEPDYFLGLFADMTERRNFIKSRDHFLFWWNKYCH